MTSRRDFGSAPLERGAEVLPFPGSFPRTPAADTRRGFEVIEDRPRDAGKAYTEDTGELTALRYTLMVTHDEPGVGRYSRRMIAPGETALRELAEAILVVFRWPKALGAEWSLRVKSGMQVRTYSGEQGLDGLGDTTAQDGLGKHAVGVLQVGGYEFYLHVLATEKVTDPGAQAEAMGTAKTTQTATADTNVADTSAAEPPSLVAADFMPLTDDDPQGALHPMGIPAVVDIDLLNRTLAGDLARESVLEHVQPELRQILLANEPTFVEFVPLLRALDLHRPAVVSERAEEVLAEVPLETDRKGRIAAWAYIIGLSTLTDEQGVDEVCQGFLATVGLELSASEAYGLASQTRAALNQLGVGFSPVSVAGSGAEPTPLRSVPLEAVPDTEETSEMPDIRVARIDRGISVVERLEVCRFLLQA